MALHAFQDLKNRDNAQWITGQHNGLSAVHVLENKTGRVLQVLGILPYLSLYMDNVIIFVQTSEEERWSTKEILSIIW